MSARVRLRLAALAARPRLPPSGATSSSAISRKSSRRARRSSPLARARWFWRQTVRCLVAPPPARRRQSPITPARRFDRCARFWPIFAMPCASSRARRRSRSRSSPSSRSASAPTPRSSASSTPCCCGRCRSSEPDRLVRLFHVPPQDAVPGHDDVLAVARQLLRLAARRTIVRGHGDLPVPAVHADRRRHRAKPSSRARVGAGFFELVRRTAGARPRVPAGGGRAGPAARVVILSDGFWKSHLGGRADVIGRTLTLDGEAYTVVGVMPAQCSRSPRGTSRRSDIWVPLALQSEQRAVREQPQRPGVARLKPGVTLAQAQSELDAISTQLEPESPEADAGWGATIVPAAGADRRRRPRRRS